MEVALHKALAPLDLVERAIQTGDGINEALLAGVHGGGVNLWDWFWVSPVEGHGREGGGRRRVSVSHEERRGTRRRKRRKKRMSRRGRRGCACREEEEGGGGPLRARVLRRS